MRTVIAGEDLCYFLPAIGRRVPELEGKAKCNAFITTPIVPGDAYSRVVFYSEYLY
jgi:hypothetical protein